MVQPTSNAAGERGGRFVRLVCFVVLAAAGMASVGLAVLAKPLANRYADSAVIHAQQRRIERLNELRTQQAELLANAQAPSVVERQAINLLNYVPTEPDYNPAISLPDTWPDLQAALETLGRPPAPTPLPYHQTLITHLADKPTTLTILLAFGCALILIATTCFNRPQQANAGNPRLSDR